MDDKSSLNSSLHQEAIDAALHSNWDKAIELNRQLLELEPENIQILNRLAKALSEIGQYVEAKSIYHQVLKIDPYNTIAEKNLKRISVFKKDDPKTVEVRDHAITFSSALFIQEPGITKIVNLAKIAEPQKLSAVSAASIVQLQPKAKSISVVDDLHGYLGVLPDDISHHLLKLMAGGNKYQAVIKSVSPKGITILIREVYRAKRFRNQSSFLDETNIVSLSSDNLKLINDDEAPAEEETFEATP